MPYIPVAHRPRAFPWSSVIIAVILLLIVLVLLWLFLPGKRARVGPIGWWDGDTQVSLYPDTDLRTADIPMRIRHEEMQWVYADSGDTPDTQALQL